MGTADGPADSLSVRNAQCYDAAIRPSLNDTIDFTSFPGGESGHVHTDKNHRWHMESLARMCCHDLQLWFASWTPIATSWNR